MPKSVEDHVATMLAEIQQQRPNPLDDTNHHTPTPDTPVEKSTPGGEDTEAIHVFFVRESELQTAMLDAASVEATPVEPITPQPVTPSPANRNKATAKNMVLSVGMFTICVLISILLFLLFIVPQFLPPTATVTIMPKTARVRTTATMQLHGRLLPTLTLSQSTTVPATGKRHQDATRAQGTITFYNGLFTSQTVGAGTILTGSDGVQVVTDQDATIPPDNPPVNGQATVAAHAVSIGSAGNIPAGDINQQCCLTAVKAVNTTGFSGGRNERDYLVVTKADIDQAEAPLTATLEKSERAALEAQLNIGEALVMPPCSKLVNSDHHTGEEATTVTVTVSETCTSVAYDTLMLHQKATQLETSEALNRFGTGYSLVGDMQVSVLHATITNQARGIAILSVKIDATYVYQLSQAQKQRITHLIAGKTQQQAEALLLQFPGIEGAQISVKGGNQTLPANPGSITIVIVERI